MTPEEKAKELIMKFCEGIWEDGNPNNSVRHVKKCALICVEEILSSWDEDGNKRLDAPIISYWQSVKDFINKNTYSI